MEIYSVFTITNLATGKEYVENIEGSGQAAVRELKSMKDMNGKLIYPFFSKIVLEGFEIDGTFCPLYIRSRRRRW